MKSLRKSFLTLLALTLFGGVGAWAQGPTQVTQVTTDLIADWQGVNENVTLADLQALGFVAVDASVAQAWTGAPQGEYSVLIYGFDGTYFNYIVFEDNGNASTPSHTGYSKSGLYNMIAGSTKHFYTGSPAIELTKSGDNQWTLGQAPDYDLELQVEYYQKHALKNIPAGWTVKVNGVEQPKPYQGDSLLITETDSVTLVPAGNPRRVKSVTLTEVPSAVLVTALTLNKTATTILAGSTETLSVTAVAPDNATDKTYTWKTSDESKATVDQDGKVTAVAAGTVTIYAEANDGSGVKGNCTVTVTPATITVTWNNNDITGTWGQSFTKDGVTITAEMTDFHDKNFMDGGTFSTTLGNFTKIEVTTGWFGASGTGWSGSGQSGTWTGNASSVSFSGDIMGMGMGTTNLVFTIEPTN